MAPQRLGQHFLKDEAWRARILRSLAPQNDQVWMEIGAGHGEMTREMARTSHKVIAIELDAPLVAALQRLAEEQPNIEVHSGDILALDLAKLGLRRGDGGERIHVYGSLPYYITSPILRRLFEYADTIESIHVVIQSEVADRLAAKPGRREYGFLSVLAQFYAQPEIVFRIPPGAFRPRPKVSSALVRLAIRRAHIGVGNEASFIAFVGKCFEQKRKTLLNNLKSVASGEKASAAIRSAELPPGVRAEELSVDDFASLFRFLR
ncbi:MAG: 16S rRNA (adenine(1518)-N(6)/adenine(1519)-N(6))-dimethyltransferase RsmA [Acidobacteria bacterium]|nr:16S rRNA (adenine(1518)-N(6)/adenine(1519)-N(6))-dimethyltransferase RsmA [Acidobacteriota bacterium]MCL5286783.1 16S rRNA (adenine(1518)-N(6)/adenine(1519)-N(6))-dimethyltransferase RsmA [Acidobacteriota bacterium]